MKCAFAISAEAGAYILRRGATKPEPVARVLARSEPIG